MTAIHSTKNHYETLGISFNATLDEIKKAYRMKVLLYHPDKTQQHRNKTVLSHRQQQRRLPEDKEQQQDTEEGIGTANEELLLSFHDILEAYNILKNTSTRSQYDEELQLSNQILRASTEDGIDFRNVTHVDITQLDIEIVDVVDDDDDTEHDKEYENMEDGTCDKCSLVDEYCGEEEQQQPEQSNSRQEQVLPGQCQKTSSLLLYIYTCRCGGKIEILQDELYCLTPAEQLLQKKQQQSSCSQNNNANTIYMCHNCSLTICITTNNNTNK